MQDVLRSQSTTIEYATRSLFHEAINQEMEKTQIHLHEQMLEANLNNKMRKGYTMSLILIQGSDWIVLELSHLR